MINCAIKNEDYYKFLETGIFCDYIDEQNCVVISYVSGIVVPKHSAELVDSKSSRVNLLVTGDIYGLYELNASESGYLVSVYTLSIGGSKLRTDLNIQLPSEFYGDTFIVDELEGSKFSHPLAITEVVSQHVLFHIVRFEHAKSKLIVMSLSAKEEHRERERIQPQGLEMNINQEYARKFEERKRKEDLARAADRGLLDEDSEQTEEDEAEDVNPEVDLQILDVIQRIRKKDPSIYDPNAKFFDSKEENQLEQDQRIKSNKQEQKKDKMTIGQYFRSSEYLGKKKEELDQEEQEESNEKENDDIDSNIIQNPKTYNEEQEEIRMKFIDAAKQTKTESMGIEGGNVDTFDLIFSKKEKTDDDLKNEEETYKKFLHNTEKQMKKKQKIKFSPTDIMKEPITEGDKLLFQYTLGRKWVNKKNARSNKQQDYASNIEQGQSEYNEEEESEQDDLSIDEEDLDLQDAFELKHNFRFEDPNATVIPSFPRGSQEGSLRRHESKRRRERESKRNRESEIQKQHNEENKRLRALIRDETQRKLREISKLAGVGLDKNKLNSKAKAILDDDDEFDEEKFDKMMSDMFNDEYYDEQEDNEEDENEIQAISREALEEEELLDINIGDKQNEVQKNGEEPIMMNKKTQVKQWEKLIN
ncbi:MAG: putative krr family protein [Streblomastix strix]|uniref:Putative krr family protein n=1 Tax=Streblomastix strix TaxID=222440 RepID=A0A5J4W9V9_9EUKA|nr:MAG: putative krr family protein [Streblomastix strix]